MGELGLDDPVTWAGMWGSDEKIRTLLAAMGVIEVDDATAAQRLGWCLTLRDRARGVGETWASGQATRRDLEVALDLAAEAKRQRLGEQEQLKARVRAPGVHSKPTAWRSRAYRRADEAGDPQARKREEEQERIRWAKKVVSILVKVGVPFGQELQEKGGHPLSPEASRCLRGLRASTLKKKASDFAPFLQYLRGHYSKAFPTSTAEVLAYYAKKTVYKTLLTALHFFDEAGEVPPDCRLANSAALEGAAREHEARRCKLAEQLGEQPGRKQALPKLLAVLAALEVEVGDEQAGFHPVVRLVPTLPPLGEPPLFGLGRPGATGSGEEGPRGLRTADPHEDERLRQNDRSLACLCVGGSVGPAGVAFGRARALAGRSLRAAGPLSVPPEWRLFGSAGPTGALLGR